ncbi:type VI secretion system baseplate subunit TssF [Paracraurococcus ruber]|uniref:Type VI secretion system ImpG/VasA family protein n=1 Tax=Paracraurococcus ruber TaxID=77675 RepID=A0ABS1D331_9PROT|nr:type VI secretion system baseplate subunit TssF [Paracraurococcus ruber]MBK1660903.1 type VI secretion system ImpG/VasA family protein [Paracraurococcus ruber]TDG28738.1 type VI secretion system baseplate subunit TssF [Paracraurococcus ruber]
MRQGDARDEVLGYYQRELHYLRQAGAEFAAAFPKVAGRLELGPDGSSDPHVERLIESVAFLTGRIQRAIDGEFPRLTDALLGLLHPQLAAPQPAAAILRLDAPALPPGGLAVPRGAMLSARTGDDLRCRFRTCAPARLWPVLAGMPECRDTGAWPFLDNDPAAAVLRLPLTLAEGAAAEMGGQALRLFLGGDAAAAARLQEVLLAGCDRIAFVPAGGAAILRPAAVALRPAGFAEEEALLPDACAVHPAHALLRDYFAFPAKFLFVDLLLPPLPPCQALDVLFLLPAPPGRLALGADSLLPGCVPAVNLFEHVAEPLRLSHTQAEHRLVPDARLEPVMEVHSVTRLRAWDAAAEAWRDIPPFFSLRHAGADPAAGWLLRRAPAARRAMGGSDAWLSLSDPGLGPDSPAELTLVAHCLCTNRLLADQVPAGARLDFDDPMGGARAICLTRPTPPRPAPQGGETAWWLVSQFALNHLSLAEGPGALAALREILLLHAAEGDAAARQQVLGLREMTCRRVTRRVGTGVRSALAQGLAITLTVDERLFAGGSALLLGAVLDRFLALHASVNGFTQLTLRSQQRGGDWHAWPPRTGAAPLG